MLIVRVGWMCFDRVPVATALQLGKGFKLTLLFSVVYSMAVIMLGLFIPYSLNVAPGGFTALVSVAVLVLVLVITKARSSISAARGKC